MALLLTAGAIAPSMASLSLTDVASSSRLSFSHSPSLVGSGALSVPSCPPISLTVGTTSPLRAVPPVYCGRGDRKTARGKRFNHSFGNARPHKKNKGKGPPRMPTPPAPPRKDKFGEEEFVEVEIDESLFT